MSYILRDYQGASHPSSISTFNCCSIFQRFLFDKKINNFADLKFVFVDYRNFTKIKKLRQFIVILSIHMRSHKKLRLSVTNKQTPRQEMYIYLLQIF